MKIKLEIEYSINRYQFDDKEEPPRKCAKLLPNGSINYRQI